VLIAVLGLASLVHAAAQTILGKQRQVKDPKPASRRPSWRRRAGLPNFSMAVIARKHACGYRHLS
jgi:hypothetical protein